MMNFKHKKLFNWAAVLSLALLFSACYPGGAEFVEDLDIVGTQFDESYDFSLAQTYALPDSVVRLEEGGGSNSPSPEADSAILERIELNMNALGYTRVDPTAPSGEDPDVYILVSAIVITNVNIWQNPWYGYWGWYGGWPGYGPGWGPGWGWGGPPVVTSYTTGTLILEIVDRESSTDQMISIVWFAAVDGLYQGSQANLTQRAINGIDQAFIQSPYLGQ